MLEFLTSSLDRRRKNRGEPGGIVNELIRVATGIVPRVEPLGNNNERRLIDLQVGRAAPHSALLYLHAGSIDRDEIFSLN